MAKKCKTCSATLPSGDEHSSCIECRSNENGDDPCVQGKVCKYCELLLKIESKKTKDSDKVTENESEGKKKDISWQDTLLSLDAKISQLTDKVASLEKGTTARQASSSTSSMKATNDQSDTELIELSDEEVDNKSNDVARDPDPNYVEMVQAIKSLLDIPEPETDNSAPPSAFKKSKSIKATKRQLCAFPPMEDIQCMWQFRSQKASGRDAKGIIDTPLHSGNFLPFTRVNMLH